MHESDLGSCVTFFTGVSLNAATHQLKGDYAASMKDYDEAMNHMLVVADVLSKGIVAQFLSEFTSR